MPRLSSNPAPVLRAKPGRLLLALFRHGPAAERDAARHPDDDGRPLTAAGRRRVESVARGLRRLGFIPERIAVSPALRARETGEILAKVFRLPQDSVRLEPALHGDADPGVLVRKTLRAAESGKTLWVGHEPGLGEAAGLFIGAPPLPLRKAGLAMLEVSPGKKGKATLKALAPPEWLAAAG